MKLLMKSMSLIINISIQLSSFKFRRSCQSTRKTSFEFEFRFQSICWFKSYRFLRPEEGTTYKIYFGFANRQTYEDFKSSDMFNDYFSKEALRHYFGSSSQHSSYFERYLYPIND